MDIHKGKLLTSNLPFGVLCSQDSFKILAIPLSTVIMISPPRNLEWLTRSGGFHDTISKQNISLFI